MAKKKTQKRERSNSKDDKILFAFLATFLSIIGFVIALITKRKDQYVMYYAKQSLIIFIIGAILGIIGRILGFLPTIGALINAAIGLLVLLIWVLSWVYALSGKEKEIPIVSEWAEKIQL
jgi:uncharacterized membrane protein